MHDFRWFLPLNEGYIAGKYAKYSAYKEILVHFIKYVQNAQETTAVLLDETVKR